MLSSSFYFLAQIVRHVSPRAIAFNFDQLYTWFLQKRLTIPASLLIQGVQLSIDVYYTSGGTADIYFGEFEGTAVAVKVPRITKVNKVKIFQDCINEIMIMDSLGHHRHIIDIFGVSLDQKTGIPCIVTPWMDYGTLSDLIRLVEPTAEYRRIMVGQIVDGMSFLKSSSVVHGDLKCSNILVAHDGRACIADFGLAHFSGATPSISSPGLSPLSIARRTFSWILQDSVPCFLNSKTCLGAGSPRWMAPERLWPDRWGILSATATFESDVFSLGMMIYEIHSGKVPFFAYNDPMTIVLIVKGIRPMRPALIADPLWRLAESCWRVNPATRPNIEAINGEFN